MKIACIKDILKVLKESEAMKVEGFAVEGTVLRQLLFKSPSYCILVVSTDI